MAQGLSRRSGYDRRDLLKNIGVMAGAGVAVSLLGVGKAGSTILAQAQAGARGAQAAGNAPAGTGLILLGTQGGPNVNLTRSQTASIVMAGGQPYLVDCGYGTVRGIVQAGLRVADIANVFVSHLHNDHTADLAALLSLKWTGGQTNPQPVAVWGPPGSKAMVEGAVAFFKGDNEIRIIDEGRTVKAETIFKGHDLSAPRVTEVFKDERVTVLAAENAHFPDRAKEKMTYRSFAYRFNASDRSIVFSGDTAYSPGLVELARNADVLVCEAMTMARHQQLLGDNRGNAANAESIERHVLETHSTTEDVGKMANEARVKTVVLYHLLGDATAGGMNDDAFIPDVKKHFNGQVIVGADQMKI
jgi:ribonuclease BN (tRNA processing enzyme)